jgi:hypothetical protein
MYLNGGTMILSRNLATENMTTFTSLGSIVGNGYACHFSRSMQQIGQSNGSQASFGNINLIFDGDVAVDAALTFSGACTINGRGNHITLTNNGSIIVATGSSLIVYDTTLKNIAGTNIACNDNTGSITYQDSILTFTNTASFTRGTLKFSGQNTMRGTQTFIYSSPQTITLSSNSHTTLDTGFTFSYAPSTGRRIFCHLLIPLRS